MKTKDGWNFKQRNFVLKFSDSSNGFLMRITTFFGKIMWRKPMTMISSVQFSLNQSLKQGLSWPGNPEFSILVHHTQPWSPTPNLENVWVSMPSSHTFRYSFRPCISSTCGLSNESKMHEGAGICLVERSLLPKEHWLIPLECTIDLLAPMDFLIVL